MIFIVVKRVKSIDLEEEHVDVEAIRERLSKRFGKDIHHLGNIAPAAGNGTATSKEDLRTLKQKLAEKFKHFKVPTLCGVRYRQITTFRPRDMLD